MRNFIHYIVSLGSILVGIGIAGSLYLVFEGLIIIPVITLVVTLLSTYFFFKLGKGERVYNSIVKAAEVIELIAIFIFLLLSMKVFGGIIWETSFSSSAFVKSLFIILIGFHILALVLLGFNKRDVVAPVLKGDITLVQALIVIAVIAGSMGFINEIFSSYLEKNISKSMTHMYTSEQDCKDAGYYWYNNTCNSKEELKQRSEFEEALREEIKRLY